MTTLYLFAVRNDVWIYILCALAFLWFGTEFVRSQRSLSRAVFRLERETALRTRNNSLAFLILFGSIAGFVAYVNLAVRDSLPSELMRPSTPTAAPFAIPAVTTSEDATDTVLTPTSPLAPTVTLMASGAPTTTTREVTATVPVVDGTSQTIQPTLPAASIAGCAPNALITDPQENAVVAGTLNVFGSANVANFGYYELEINGPQTNEQWASLLGRRIRQSVTDGFLGGNFNLRQWAPGTYILRLTVANDSDEVMHQCSVSILLQP